MKVRLLGVPQGRRVTFLLPVGECDPARRHREIAYKAKDLLQGFGREIGGIMRADFFFFFWFLSGGGRKVMEEVRAGTAWRASRGEEAAA